MTTDRGEICGLLEGAVAIDPVRNTVLGTVLTSLERGEGDGWCAVWDTWLAARSSPATRVVLTNGWDEPDPLVEALLSLNSLAGVSGPVAVADTVARGLEGRGTMHRTPTRLFRLDDLIEPAVAGAARSTICSARPASCCRASRVAPVSS